MRDKLQVFTLAWLLLFAVSFVGIVSAEEMAKPAGKDVTITGYVRDPGCLLKMGMKGEKHAMCAKKCAEMGQTLAIEDENGNLYVSLAAKEGGNPNEKIIDFAEQKVTVKGKILSNGGLSGILISSVKKAK